MWYSTVGEIATKIVLGMVAIRLSMGATAGFYYVADIVVITRSSATAEKQRVSYTRLLGLVS